MGSVLLFSGLVTAEVCMADWRYGPLGFYDINQPNNKTRQKQRLITCTDSEMEGASGHLLADIATLGHVNLLTMLR